MKPLIKLCGSACIGMLLVACTIGNGRICGPQTPRAYCDKEAYERLVNPKPYGAHWIKEGMTRESRRLDLVDCGGGENLSEGYKEWLSSVPYETYSEGKRMHIRAVSLCMQSKSYVWLEVCDARCLYP